MACNLSIMCPRVTSRRLNIFELYQDEWFEMTARVCCFVFFSQLCSRLTLKVDDLRRHAASVMECLTFACHRDSFRKGRTHVSRHEQPTEFVLFQLLLYCSNSCGQRGLVVGSGVGLYTSNFLLFC